MLGPEQILKYKAGLTCICLVNFKHELNLVHLFLSVANSWYSACWTRNTDWLPALHTDFVCAIQASLCLNIYTTDK